MSFSFRLGCCLIIYIKFTYHVVQVQGLAQRLEQQAQEPLHHQKRMTLTFYFLKRSPVHMLFENVLRRYWLFVMYAIRSALFYAIKWCQMKMKTSKPLNNEFSGGKFVSSYDAPEWPRKRGCFYRLLCRKVDMPVLCGLLNSSLWVQTSFYRAWENKFQESSKRVLFLLWINKNPTSFL